MSETNTVTASEIANIRNNIHLLRNQVKLGKIEEPFLARQLEKLDDLLQRLDQQHSEKVQEIRFKALYDVSRVLGASLDLNAVLDQVMDAIIELTGAERGFLMLRDDDGGVTVKAARNLDHQTLDSTEFKFSRTVTNIVLDDGEPILTTNATEDPRFAGKESIIAQSLRSVMATPLRARGNVIGVVYVDNRALEGLFNEADLAALDTFSAQAAIALDNAILFSETDEALHHRIEELSQLRRIDLQLNSTLDAQEAIEYTLEWACRISGATHGHLGLLDEGNIRFMHHYGQTASNQMPEFQQIPDVVQSRQSVIFKTDNNVSVMITPILREQEVVGIVVLQCKEDKHFITEQQDLVERIVARAAITIENTRLYEAVQAADRAKSEFVGIVAHDLKSPMTGIKGYADLMLMDEEEGELLTEQQVDYLHKIIDTVNRMEILVSDLADISRIESGHFFMDESVVSVYDIIQSVKDTALPQIQARSHVLIEKIEDNLPNLWVDYFRLIQVLTNLMSNAYKYTPDGGTITLSAKKVADRVQFCVEDTGIGLSEEARKMLGTKFWRSSDKYTRKQPGAGLGYSITRSLIEQMGSEIEVSSKLKEGSKFTFSVMTSKD